MSDGRGLPLLSGQPNLPAPSADASCRKCNKDLRGLFTRGRRCNHCGYMYCTSCSDFSALMPRAGEGYNQVPVCGFCIEHLTMTAGGRQYLKGLPLAKLRQYLDAYGIRRDGAIEKGDLVDLIISARGPDGCLPPANEQFYRRHSVPAGAAHRPRGLFARALNPDDPPPQQRPAQRPPPAAPAAASFARPDLDRSDDPSSPAAAQAQAPSTPPRAPPQQQHQQQQQQQYQPPPGAPPPRTQHPYPPTWAQQARYASPQPQARQQQQQHRPPPGPPPSQAQGQGASPYGRPSAANSHTNVNNARAWSGSPPQAARQRATSAGRPPAAARAPAPAPMAPTPAPTLDELLEMPRERVAALSIGALKAALFRNHVRAEMVLEKGELVERVLGMVADERRERAREAAAHEAEEEAARARAREQREAREEEERRRGAREAGEEMRASEEAARGTEAGEDAARDEHARERDAAPRMSQDAAGAEGRKSTEARAQAQAMLERTGLCVICQDEEANIAIVDCGHLAMCRPCSDLIMASSRECPLCRTRIVTEARLLRIFKS